MRFQEPFHHYKSINESAGRVRVGISTPRRQLYSMPWVINGTEHCMIQQNTALFVLIPCLPLILSVLQAVCYSSVISIVSSV